MSKKINFIGRFYFKLTDSKNLIGEFSNSGGDKRIYAESAIRIIPDVAEGNFVGEYYHTWCHLDDSDKPAGVVAILKIEELKKISRKIFSLEWVVLNGNPNDRNLWGEGMLCDGMLIGDYRNFKDCKNCNHLPSP